MSKKLHTLYNEILNLELKPSWKWMIVRDPELTPTVDEFDTFEDFLKYGEVFHTPTLKKGTDIVSK